MAFIDRGENGGTYNLETCRPAVTMAASGGRPEVVGLRRHVKGHTLLSWRNYISFAGNPAFAAVHLPPEHQHGSQYDERPDSCKWLAGKRPIAFNRDNADKISSSLQR
ncbi:MAG: hypothetical protein ABWY64_02955 [Tardiphaga sp.]